MAPSNAELQNRLSRAAKKAADERRLDLDASAQNALGDLVAQAADALEGLDEAEIERAEASFRRLAGQLARSGRPDDGVEERSIEPRSPPFRGPVRDRDIRSALVDLCPGFWPFC